MSRENWDVERLFGASDYRVIGEEGALEKILYANEPYRGKDTDVFAYLGVPESNAPVPGMVCVHGGGGKAFSEWVQKWVDRGYAAIAMDLSGRGEGGERLPNGGPEQGHEEKFDTEAEWQDMWTYHAIAAVIRAHSILRGIADVDADRIGVTGISWGGYLTCVVSGVDDRFICAIPVYGCGFLQDNSAEGWIRLFEGMTPERQQWWHDYCDPSIYLQHATMPMLFVSGTNDFPYPIDSLQKSYRLPKGPVSLCIRLEMRHGHKPGWDPEEIGLFVDHLCGRGGALPQIGEMTAKEGCVEAIFTGSVVKGDLVYTCESGHWPERKWHAMAATVQDGTVRAVLPKGWTVCYLMVEDERGAYASAPHVEAL